MSDTTSRYRIVFHSLPKYDPALWSIQERRWWGWKTLATDNMLRIETLLLQLRELENKERKETQP